MNTLPHTTRGRGAAAARLSAVTRPADTLPRTTLHTMGGAPLPLHCRGRRDYAAEFAAMRRYTRTRGAGGEDQLWLLEHWPVYTLGRRAAPVAGGVNAGSRSGFSPAADGAVPVAHADSAAAQARRLRTAGGVAPVVQTDSTTASAHRLRAANAIPVVHSDRGGQATYHGPGQAVLYTLLDLKRRGLGVRRYVGLLEEAVIVFLGDCGVRARRLPGAPGVYVGARKIASLGLSVFNGRCYHGVALNVCMDLSPFAGIVACGQRGVKATQLADCGVAMDVESAGAGVARSLAARL